MKLTKYYSDTCKCCDDFNNTWNMLKETYPNYTFNEWNITNNLDTPHKITAVPTTIIEDDNNNIVANIKGNMSYISLLRNYPNIFVKN